MKYYVTYAIDARFVAKVEADSIEEAMEKAENEYMDADFGDIDDVVDVEIVTVEDEKGNYLK